jgi:hypothetical protein
MASMQAISERVKSITETLTKPQVLPFTVVGGAVVATAAGFGLWRLLTGAREGPLSEDQAVLKSERKVTLGSKKTVVVRRVVPSCAATQAIGALIAAHMTLNSDPVLEAVTPEVRTTLLWGLGRTARWLDPQRRLGGKTPSARHEPSHPPSCLASRPGWLFAVNSVERLGDHSLDCLAGVLLPSRASAVAKLKCATGLHGLTRSGALCCAAKRLEGHFHPCEPRSRWDHSWKRGWFSEFKLRAEL